jgi:hypothetical protein
MLSSEFGSGYPTNDRNTPPSPAEGTPEFELTVTREKAIRQIKGTATMLSHMNRKKVIRWCIAAEASPQNTNWSDLENLLAESPSDTQVVSQSCPSFSQYLNKKSRQGIVTLPPDEGFDDFSSPPPPEVVSTSEVSSMVKGRVIDTTEETTGTQAHKGNTGLSKVKSGF